MSPLTKKLFWLFVVAIPLAPILLGVLLLSAISSNTPIAEKPAPITGDTAMRIKRVTTQLKYGLMSHRQRSIVMAEQDINAMLAFAHRSASRATAKAELKQNQMIVKTSIHLPENPFGEYINLEFAIPNFKQQLQLEYLTIGKIDIPGGYALQLLEKLFNFVVGGTQGSELIQSFKSMRVNPQHVFVTYLPIQNITRKLTAAINNSRRFSEDSRPVAEPERVKHYYTQLCLTATPRNTTSLSQHLHTLFTQAKQQSQQSNSASEENRAALMALAIFFGSYKFNAVVDAIPNELLKPCQQKRSKATLAQRKDLALHFIYSAAFQLIADSNMSLTVGELKELQDSLWGGSGFSFADLAADQAGISFATMASHPSRSRYLHTHLNKLEHEHNFFPSIHDLKEGIPQKEFEHKYGGLDGELYNQKLEKIKTRVAQLPIYSH